MEQRTKEKKTSLSVILQRFFGVLMDDDADGRKCIGIRIRIRLVGSGSDQKNPEEQCHEKKKISKLLHYEIRYDS